MTAHSRALRAAVLLVLAAAARPVPAQAPASVPAAPAPDGAGRWEAKMKEYEAQDAAGAVPPGRILFIGSSSITRWKLADYFPRKDLVNRGFGGSLLRQVADLADRYVFAIRPRQIVVYAGENDLAAGRSEDQAFEAYRDLVEKIRARMPDVPVLFVSLKPSPSRRQLQDGFRAVNRRIAEDIARRPGVTYVDVFSRMLDANGEPRTELYHTDRLHLSDAGYRLWVEIIGPQLLPETPSP